MSDRSLGGSAASAGWAPVLLAVGAVLSLAAMTTHFAGCAGDDGVPTLDATEPPISEWVPGHYGLWSPVATPDTPLSVLLISIDTTRQDRLSCYGFAQPTTPNLDALAADGVLFERANTPVPVTLPSHTTMLTGLYPFHHGVRNNGTYVAGDSLRTLAEELGKRGYRTGAVLGAFPVAEQFGLNQGFDRYDDEFPTTSTARESDTAQRRADDVTNRSLEWIDETGGAGGAPFFLWSHYFDPHFPYAPPEPFGARYSEDPYAGEIAYMDQEIGRLLDGLKERGLYEQTVIIVAADHGEGLGQHREMTHSFFIYNTTQRIPFLVRLPKTGPFSSDKWRGGKRIGDMVGLIDILPTALHAVGFQQSETPLTDGKSLLPVIEGKGSGHNWVYHETLIPRLEYGTSELRSLETFTHKYIRAPRPELYVMSPVADVGEENNIAQRDNWIVDEMETQLSGLLRAEGNSAPQVEMDEETIEQLRSLGYLAGSSGSDPDNENLPDPKDMVWAFEAVNAARTLMAGFRYEDALAKVDSVLAENPNDGTAKRIRGSALVRLERGEEAIAAYDDLLEDCDQCPDQLDLLRDRAIASLVAKDFKDALERIAALRQAKPERGEYARLLAQTYVAQSRFDEAREAVKEAIELDPEDVEAWAILGDLESASGNVAGAEEAYRQALTLQGNHVSSLVALVEILIDSNRTAAARGLTEQAYAADPNHPMVLFRKGWFAKADGRVREAIEFYERSLAANPNDPVTLHNLGNLYMDINPGQAFEIFQRAIDTGEARQKTYVNMGVLYARQRRMPEAIRMWEEAVRRDPNNPDVPGIEQNIAQARQEIQRNAFRPK